MSSFCFPLAYAQEGKQNVSSLYSVIVAVKKKGRSILSFKEKAAPFIVSYFLRMRPSLGVKYLPMFAYVTAVCLFHIQQFVCLCKHNQVTFGSVIVNLNPLQFELTETETHHLKIWYFQISCIFLGPHRIHRSRDQIQTSLNFCQGGLVSRLWKSDCNS